MQTDKFHLRKILYLVTARIYRSEATLLILNIYSFFSFKKMTPEERLLSRKRDLLKCQRELPLLSVIFSFDRSFYVVSLLSVISLTSSKEMFCQKCCTGSYFAKNVF